ncbi:MAG: Nucleoside diphosphate kinase [Candidatus Heimdallarchaeota archaeon LC_2]|nr:MAG: Nucleoside diphosphate kinase [Candidatus Heimdallarchaeota archaeon LC_2]
MSNEERSFIMIKPDAVQRGLTGEIISRIESSGLKIVAMKFLKVTQELAEKHYEIHKERPFYKSLVSFITSSPTVALVVEGLNAISIGRKLVGATNPADALPGTIRGDYGLDIGRNLVHASDSVENGKIETAVYFDMNEIVTWSPIGNQWIYE